MADRYLAGRAAMVTGGASGMGRAMALAFAQAGADVAIGSLLAEDGSGTAEGELAYLPGRKTLDAAAKEIEGRGVRALPVNLDVTSDESVRAFYDATVAAFGKVDIVANAAGITTEQTICGHPDSAWVKVIDVNLHGTYRTIKLCLPGMIERGWGRIINIASTAAVVAAPTSPAYSASKAAVVALSRCVALEGAPHGVTCNAISPGWVESDFGKKWAAHIAEKQQGCSAGEFIAELKASNPQRRMVQPQEVGAYAAFLCRDEAVGITMEDLRVSAGALL